MHLVFNSVKSNRSHQHERAFTGDTKVGVLLIHLGRKNHLFCQNRVSACKENTPLTPNDAAANMWIRWVTCAVCCSWLESCNYISQWKLFSFCQLVEAWSVIKAACTVWRISEGLALCYFSQWPWVMRKCSSDALHTERTSLGHNLKATLFFLKWNVSFLLLDILLVTFIKMK